MDSYEVGLKGDLGDALRFSLSGFHSKYEDIQVFVSDDANPAPDILNAAEASITGLDFEAELNLSTALSIDAQITWMPEAEYDSFEALDGPTLVDFSGARLTRSPEFTGVFGMNLFHALSDRVDLAARAECYVTSDIAFSQAVLLRPDALEEDGYTLVNFHASATFDDRTELRVYGRNVGDTFYKTLIVESVGFITQASAGRASTASRCVFGSEAAQPFDIDPEVACARQAALGSCQKMPATVPLMLPSGPETAGAGMGASHS